MPITKLKPKLENTRETCHLKFKRNLMVARLSCYFQINSSSCYTDNIHTPFIRNKLLWTTTKVVRPHFTTNKIKKILNKKDKMHVVE